MIRRRWFETGAWQQKALIYQPIYAPSQPDAARNIAVLGDAPATYHSGTSYTSYWTVNRGWTFSGSGSARIQTTLPFSWSGPHTYFALVHSLGYGGGSFGRAFASASDQVLVIPAGGNVGAAFGWIQNGPDFPYASTSGLIGFDRWHSYAVAKDRVFLDGRYLLTLNGSQYPPATAQTSIDIGNRNAGDRAAHGYVALLAFWDGVATDAEMAQVHNDALRVLAGDEMASAWRRPTFWWVPPSDGIVITPTAASAAATASDPTVVLGALTITPTAASAAATASDPTVVLGALTITPTAASAAATASDPTVVLGALTITPATASAAATASDPTVVLGALTITPTAASAAATASDPTVVLGALTITPTAASAAATASDPTVVLGAITPTPASAAATASDPTVVLGALTITPATASAAATASDPMVTIIVIAALVTLTVNRSFQLSSIRSFMLTMEDRNT